MQAPDTKRLSRKIRKLREKKVAGKLTPWRVVCETLNIRTQEDAIDPGMAYKIAYQDYEPSDRHTRARLGLRDICSKCRRAFRAVKPMAEKKSPSQARQWWNKMKSGEREQVLEWAYSNYLKWKQDHEHSL